MGPLVEHITPAAPPQPTVTDVALGERGADGGHGADWETRAACRAVDNAAELFFSEDIGDIAAAKRVCAECPVLSECLGAALERGESFGVWGGQLFMNGKMLMIKRRRGRPPKNPRPEDQLPVIPIPAHLVESAQQLIA